MEDKVYTINWSHSETEWTLWVKGRPEWRGVDKDRREAEKQLVDQIMDRGGAMHPVFEYEPALPVEEWETRLVVPELYLIGGGNDRFDSDKPEEKGDPLDRKAVRLARQAANRKWEAAFYQSEACPVCKHQPGPRTNKPLQVLAIGSGTDAAFGSAGREMGYTSQIFSESFLELLTEEERSRLKFLEVVRSRTYDKSRKRFFELVGPRGPAEVAVRGFELGGWQCSACGYNSFTCFRKGGQMQHFLAAEDLPRPLPGLFTIVSGDTAVALCATGERWRQLKRQKGTKGFISNRLGVVPEELVLRKFTLQTLEEAVFGGSPHPVTANPAATTSAPPKP